MLEKFHYKLPDSYELVLPKFDFVPAGLIRKTRKLNAADGLFTILEDLLTDEDLSHLDKMSRAELNEFTTRWQQDSGVTVGESSASSS